MALRSPIWAMHDERNGAVVVAAAVAGRIGADAVDAAAVDEHIAAAGAAVVADAVAERIGADAVDAAAAAVDEHIAAAGAAVVADAVAERIADCWENKIFYRCFPYLVVSHVLQSPLSCSLCLQHPISSSPLHLFTSSPLHSLHLFTSSPLHSLPLFTSSFSPFSSPPAWRNSGALQSFK